MKWLEAVFTPTDMLLIAITVCILIIIGVIILIAYLDWKDEISSN